MSARRWIAALATLVLGLSLTVDAFAQSRPPPPRDPVVTNPSRPKEAARVEVEVLVIHATEAHTRVDPNLRSLMRHVKHLKFTGFSLLSKSTVTVGDGQNESMNIVGSRRLKVDLISHDDKQAKARFRLFKGDKSILDTTVRIDRNRTFLVMGPSHDGGVLMLPVTVRY